MSFTILFAALVLFALLVIFGITYKIKGLKTALIATGVMFILSAVAYVAVIYLIVSAMPNCPARCADIHLRFQASCPRAQTSSGRKPLCQA